jgi:class 3 adenylate cyclase
MEALVKHLAKFGGDIIKFVGDAMIVMWPRASKNKIVGKDDEGDPESENI